MQRHPSGSEGYRRAFRFRLQTFLLLCGLLCSMSASAFTKTWAPFGYSVSFVFNYPYTTPPPVYATYQAVCAQYPPLIGDPTSDVCYEPTSDVHYCVTKGFSCGDPYSWPISPAPICTYTNLIDIPPIISTRPPRTRSVRAYVGWSGTASACGCLDYSMRPMSDVVPDFKTGYCYDPLGIYVVTSRTQYKPSEANVPVTVTTVVQRSDGTPAANTPITLRVTTTDGTPGTITPASGVTNDKGELVAYYTYPQFDKKKVDTIEIGCDDCSTKTTQANITMAPTVIGFFNGVWNTREAAQKSLERLRIEFGNQFRTESGIHKDERASLKYDFFYNQTGCGDGVKGKLACLEDVAEVFAQRDQEMGGVLSNRWEVFWEMLSGTHTKSTSLTGTLLGHLGGLGNAFLQLIDSTFSAILNKLVALTGSLLSNPPTTTDIANQVGKLTTYADDNYTLLLVAHSQGNLFVNAAYDGLLANRSGANAKVVHVAPASPTLRGRYLLADIDVVINGLRISGINSVQPVNIYLPTSTKDVTGHTFEGTYMDTARKAYGMVRWMVIDALEAL